MAKRHPNPQLVKIHRSYTVGEVAKVCNKHKNTVRNWIKNGLAVIDDKRPLLIYGLDLRVFLKERRVKNKHTCKPGEIYCVGCRVPKHPAENMAEYTPVTEKVGNLAAICPDCDSIINRRVSLAKIWEVCGNLDITFPQELQHIVESNKPTVNSDLR